MRILISGATGLIGNRMIPKLIAEGHEIRVLTRNPAKISPPLVGFEWDVEENIFPEKALDGVDAVISLAGESVAQRRWSREQKAKIYNSRVIGTRMLVDHMERMAKPPQVFLSASATGFYGDRGDEVLTENSLPGGGFLATVCKDWEKEIKFHSPPTTRRIAIRIGIVLASEGGALKKMLPIFKTGLAGPLGNGKQWMSWVHIDDLVSLFLFALKNPQAKGPINGVAPNPVTNAVFTKALAKTLRRPAFLPAPAFALKIALGEMSELLLGSVRVIPEQAKELGFQFQHPTIDGALSDLLVQREKLRKDAGEKFQLGTN